MTFEIAASVASAAMAFVVNIKNDLGACGFSAGIVRIAVGDDDIGTLRFSTIGLVRLLQSEAMIVVTNRAKHDHSRAECELGVGDGVVFARDDEMLFETEGVTEPLDGGGSVAITEAGDDGRADRWNSCSCGHGEDSFRGAWD